MKVFNLPDLGEGLPDAEIHQWYVKEGDFIQVDQPLVSMETAKAVVDIPSPRSGTILKLHGQPGDIIKTGAALVEFSEEESENHQGSGATVAGAIEVGETILEETAIGIGQRTQTTSTVKATPSVRALAKKLHVALDQVIPTGSQGQITPEDIQKAAQKKDTAVTTGQYISQPLRGVRRAMAHAMIQSHQQVVPVTLVDDADIHCWSDHTDITYRVIRALVKACKTEPALNAHFDFEKLERKLYEDINVGIAMDSSEGLFVPVLKSAQNKDAQTIRTIINGFKDAVQQRTITAEELQGSTIQLSNFGTFAGKYANPIIIPPVVAILGTGKIRHQTVPVNNNHIEVHPILPLSLTIDHRAVTGGEGARFLKALLDDLQQQD